MVRIVDANAIIRYLLNDIPNNAKETYNFMKNGFTLYPEVIAEAIYVLDSVYECKKQDVANALLDLIEYADMDDKNIYEDALKKYSKFNFDFVDCVILSRVEINGDKILTFDKKLENQILKIKEE